MTLFPSLPRRLISAFGLALVCTFPAAYSLSAISAELEGTVVPLDQATPAPIVSPSDVPKPESASVPPSKESSEYQQWLQEHKDYAREQEDYAREQEEYAREQAEHAREMETQKHDHQNWERDWEKNLSKAFGGDHEDSGDFHPALLIPLFAIVFIFGGPIILLILILVFFFGAKRRRQQDINMNIDKLLAAGRDIPVELLRGDAPKNEEPVGSRDKGIRNIFLGTGWLVFLTIMVGFDIGSAGFIWIALGASQVVIWYLNRPNVSEQAGQQD